MKPIQLRYEVLGRDIGRLEGWVTAAQLQSDYRLRGELQALRSRHAALESRVSATGRAIAACAHDLDLDGRIGDIAADAKRVWRKLTRGY